MKKIMLITFHRAQSYGAFLQAYALQNCSVLKEYTPTYIDYYPPRFQYRNFVRLSTDGGILIALVKFIPALVLKTRMHLCLKKYVSKYLKLTDTRYYNNRDLERIANEADIFISGSDQIWDLRYDDLNNVLPYYLNFANGIRIAYASSCGEMEYYENRDNPDYKILLQELTKFKAISCREKKSALDLNKCRNYNAQMCLDPTFLLDEREWSKVLPEKVPNEKYILVYGLYRNPDLVKYAKCLADMKHLKIYNICDMLDAIKDAKNIINVNPFNLLWLIKNAEHVVTDSFHGCALSINFSRTLHIFMPRTSKIRINNLVEVFRIEDRVVHGEVLTKVMDYSAINNILASEREKAYEFLKHGIES